MARLSATEPLVRSALGLDTPPPIGARPLVLAGELLGSAWPTCVPSASKGGTGTPEATSRPKKAATVLDFRIRTFQKNEHVNR
jgi:hypothetical protein